MSQIKLLYEMSTKHCHKCNTTLSISCFHKNKSRKDGLATACKKCRNIQNKEYRHRYPEKRYQREKKDKEAIKIEVFEHYSEEEIKCTRCSFSDLRALTIDHINGGGSEHRKQLGIRGGTQFYRWIKNNDYPKEFQILCMNCQWIKRHENNEHTKHK